MFIALVDGEVVNLDHRAPSAITPEDKWDLYNGKPLVLCRGCNGHAHIRLLSEEKPFMVFAHNAGYGEVCRALGYHTDESEHHYDLKSRLADAARKAGWSADMEVYGDHCRADVVATSPQTGRKRVLEAQISAIKAGDVVDRTERYIGQFGRVTWTHKGRRSWANRHPDVEALRVDDEGLATVVEGITTDTGGFDTAPPAPLEGVVPKVLTGRLRYLYEGSDRRGAFGYYVDLAAANLKESERRRPQQRSLTPPQGHYVEECARPPVKRDSSFVADWRRERVAGWGHEEWEGRARMARARRSAHGEDALDEIDLESLRRSGS
jgi:hypothetical protein